MPHSTIEIPEKITLYIQKEMVPFPYMIFPVFVDDHDLHTFTEADKYDKFVGMVLRRLDAVNGNSLNDIYEIGTLCRVTQIKKVGDGKFKVTLEGVARLRILELEPTAPVTLARCE